MSRRPRKIVNYSEHANKDSDDSSWGSTNAEEENEQHSYEDELMSIDSLDEQEEQEEQEDAPDDSPVAKRRKKYPVRKSKAKKVINENDDDDDDDDDVWAKIPTSHRKTSHGGYAHTLKSRLKISRANRGNTPWNKGKNRSSTAKANISLGVRARNRERLLQKCQRLKMSEEEYFKLTKEVKNTRELLRRTKKKLEEMEEGKGRKKTMNSVKKLKKRKKAVESAKVAAMNAQELEPGSESDHESDEELKKIHPLVTMFAKDYTWTPQSLDTVDYGEICPKGGSGGLTCCTVCTATYSKYLSSTFGDLEQQDTRRVAKELQDSTKILKDAKKQIVQTIRSTRRKIPPVGLFPRGATT